MRDPELRFIAMKTGQAFGLDESIQREIEMLKKMDHPLVVRLCCSKTDKQNSAITTKFIANGSLADNLPDANHNILCRLTGPTCIARIVAGRRRLLSRSTCDELRFRCNIPTSWTGAKPAATATANSICPVPLSGCFDLYKEWTGQWIRDNAEGSFTPRDEPERPSREPTISSRPFHSTLTIHSTFEHISKPENPRIIQEQRMFEVQVPDPGLCVALPLDSTAFGLGRINGMRSSNDAILDIAVNSPHGIHGVRHIALFPHSSFRKL
jgi:hypothetical protein